MGYFSSIDKQLLHTGLILFFLFLSPKPLNLIFGANGDVIPPWLRIVVIFKAVSFPMGNGHENYNVVKNGKIAVKSKPMIIIMAKETEAMRNRVLRLTFQNKNFID